MSNAALITDGLIGLVVPWLLVTHF